METEQKEREATEPKGPALDEILAHPEDNTLFSKYLENGDDGDQILAGKLLAGELGADDFHALSEKRKGFLQVKEKAKNMRERLEKNMDGMINASPQLREIVQVAGMEAVRKAMIKRMDEIAITDPEGFADLEGRFNGLTAAEEVVGRGNERIAALCKEHGFTETEYTKALMAREAGDPYALEDLIKSKMGTFQKAFTSYEELTQTEGDIDTRQDIKARLSQVNWNLNNIGGALSTKMFEDPATKEILIANLKKEKGPDKDVSFAEMNGLLKRPGNPKAIRDAWENYQNEHSGDDGYTIEEARERFGNQYAERSVSKKRRGFWATIFRAMLAGSVREVIR